MSTWNEKLTGKQAWLLCSAVLLLHVIPLLMADMPVLDDQTRQYGASNDWLQVGRPLVVVLNAVLGFGPAAVNIYPLPLLLAVLVTGHALAHLVQYWFQVPTFSAVLVVLPVWLQPFFLQNLSYQYDGAAMGLALACGAWAVTLGCERLRHWLGGVVLLAACAALYQPGLSVVAGLFGIDVMRRVMEGNSIWLVTRFAALRLCQLLAGVSAFYVSCAWLVQSQKRASFLRLDGQWLGELYRRLAETAGIVDLLATPWIYWLYLGLALLALIGLRCEMVALWRRPAGYLERLGLTLLLLGVIPFVAASTAGVTLFLAEFSADVRTLMGLGAALVLLLYLVHGALRALPRVRLVVLCVALLPMLSLSFAYGRVLVAQKALHQSIATSLAYDLSSRPALAAAEHYYISGFWQSGLWVPAAAGTLQHMPVIERFDPSWYVVLPEMLPQVGVDYFGVFYQAPPLNREQVHERSPVPLVTHRLYDIHLVGDDAYVLIKLPSGTGDGQDH